MSALYEKLLNIIEKCLDQEGNAVSEGTMRLIFLAIEVRKCLCEHP